MSEDFRRLWHRAAPTVERVEPQEEERKEKRKEMTYYCVSLNLFIIRNAFGRIDVISVIAALIGLTC